MTTTKREPNLETPSYRSHDQPGKILAAYSLFPNYSLGNALLTNSMRNARYGPAQLPHFFVWKAVGRYVRKGQKAISLVMPVTCKKRDQKNQEVDESRDTRESDCLTFAFLTPDTMSSL